VQALGLLLTEQADVFVRYCRKQAEQYDAKDARAFAARQALEVLAVEETARGTVMRATSGGPHRISRQIFPRWAPDSS